MDLRRHWYLFYYDRIETDQAIEPFLKLRSSIPWLKRAREAHFLSINHVAQKAGVCRSTYLRFENDEKSGKITLATLRKCAEAMDCELIYAIRPKRGLFSDSVWNAITKDGLPKTISGLLRKQYDYYFRHQHGWCRNRSGPWNEYSRLSAANRDIGYHANSIRRRKLPPD